MLLAVSSMLLTQQYMLKKSSLNRNTHKIRLSFLHFVKCCDQKLKEANPEFPQEQRLSYLIANSVFVATLKNTATVNNKNLMSMNAATEG